MKKSNIVDSHYLKARESYTFVDIHENTCLTTILKNMQDKGCRARNYKNVNL